MKLIIGLVFILCTQLVGTVTTTPAQEPPKAVLEDQFARSNCEDLLARLDNYLISLQNDPSATGYVIIYGKAKPAATARNEIMNWVRFRMFEPTRIRLERGGARGLGAELEFWLVPVGAERPVISPQATPADLELPKPDLSKPFVFTAHYSDEVGGCGEPFDVTGFAELIKANPKSRGKVVISEPSVKRFREVEKEIVGELTGNGLPRTRFRTVHMKVKPNALSESVELWFIP